MNMLHVLLDAKWHASSSRSLFEYLGILSIGIFPTKNYLLRMKKSLLWDKNIFPQKKNVQAHKKDVGFL